MDQSSASYELVHAYPPGMTDAHARIVRASLPARQLGRRIAELSDTHTSVLIAGETGTGKTLLANELVARRARGGRDLTVNCASLADAQLAQLVFEFLPPQSTIESAPPGTLFFDDVGELSPWGQAVLLRALSDREPSCAPRLVCTSSRDLESMVQEGAFSGELLLRLRGVTLSLLPLRERVHEIGALALHFVRLSLLLSGIPVISIDPCVIDTLERHVWPGNVRELQNTIAHAVAVCSDGLLRVDCLPEPLQAVARLCE